MSTFLIDRHEALERSSVCQGDMYSEYCNTSRASTTEGKPTGTVNSPTAKFSIIKVRAGPCISAVTHWSSYTYPFIGSSSLSLAEIAIGAPLCPGPKK